MMSEGLDRVWFWLVLRAGSDPVEGDTDMTSVMDAVLLRVFVSDGVEAHRRDSSRGWRSFAV